MRRILLISLVLVCAATSAQIFRRTGPDGKVYFSDRPGPDAEQIEVAPAQTINLRPLPATTGSADTSNAEDDASPSYAEFTILSPGNGQEIRANNGNITVRLLLQPELMTGDTIVLNVDGEDGEAVETGDRLVFELANLSRGRHTVEARVIGADGEELIQAGPVSFNVLRAAVGG